MTLNDYLNILIEKKSLSLKQGEDLATQISSDSAPPAMISAILVSLRMKGETKEEIAGFIKALRKKMLKVKSENAIDIVGTGGDNSGSFNISTAASFVVSGAGVKVAKHGNRAASSKCGSADVLEALGVNINLDSIKVEKVLIKVGMVFLFAPNFHPAFKYVIPVRKELKIRTIFNILGPFLNPAGVERKLLGVANIDLAEKLSEVAKLLNYQHLMIVSSEDGMDEISLSAKTNVFDIKGKTVKRSEIFPEDFGFKKVSKEEIMGGDARENAEIIKEILSGKIGPKTDIVLLNSAFALYASGKVENIKEGIRLAKISIDSGNALKVLENLIKETNK